LEEDVVEALLTALMSRWATVSEPPLMSMPTR
jgi:hypothetical protein